MKVRLLTVCLVVFFVLMSGSAQAQDPELEDIFMDGLYGGLAGALVGAAALAFTSEPKDHLNSIAIGAGVGVIVGTAYGIYSASRVFAEFRDSRLRLRVPFPRIVVIRSATVKGIHRAEFRADLLRIHF